MSTLSFLVSWGNAPFAIAIGVVGTFVLLQVTGLLGLVAGGGGSEGEHDVGGGGDVDHDVDHDADADGDHDGDSEDDRDAGGHGRSFAAAILAPLGFGTIPFSVIWETFALAFSAVGFALNLRYVEHVGGPPLYSLVWTLPAGFVAGCLGSAGVTRVLGPVLSSKGQEATTRAQLVGQIGVVISSKVDRDFGEVRIRDKTGHDVRVVCRLASGATRSAAESQSVVVVDYDEKGGLLVEPLEDGDLGIRPGHSGGGR